MQLRPPSFMFYRLIVFPDRTMRGSRAWQNEKPESQTRSTIIRDDSLISSGNRV